MKKSIIVFLSWLILVTIYRIYTTKRREGFQNKVACQLIENSQQMKDYITNSKYVYLLSKYIKWENLTDMSSMFKNNNSSFIECHS